MEDKHNENTIKLTNDALIQMITKLIISLVEKSFCESSTHSKQYGEHSKKSTKENTKTSEHEFIKRIYNSSVFILTKLLDDANSPDENTDQSATSSSQARLMSPTKSAQSTQHQLPAPEETGGASAHP